MMNTSLDYMNAPNSSLLDDAFQTHSTADHLIFAKHEFIQSNPWLAFPVVLVLFAACVIGTMGNILILLSVLICAEVRTVESTFIVNLALSDLYVTVVADPFSIVGKLEGEHFFDSVPGLCQTVASICTVSCISSLTTIAMMSINRYFFICRQEDYRKLFTKRNCILICLSLYGIGIILVLMNALEIGDHSFDRKSLECIWDRMATYPYTVVFSVALVWVPLIITGTCYVRIYAYVRAHRRKIQQQNVFQGSITSSHRKQQIQLVKTLFLIYAVFMTCWVPYALLIVIDYNDTLPHQVHVFSTVFAHLHPSLNWLIYYLTNKRFAKAYRYLLNCGKQESPGGTRRLFERDQPHLSLENIKNNHSDTNEVCHSVNQNGTDRPDSKTATEKVSNNRDDSKCIETVHHMKEEIDNAMPLTVIDS